MDTNPLLVVHYDDLISTLKKEVSTLNSSSNDCKDDIVHCLSHSPPTSICPMFFKVVFYLQDAIQLLKKFKFTHWTPMV